MNDLIYTHKIDDKTTLIIVEQLAFYEVFEINHGGKTYKLEVMPKKLMNRRDAIEHARYLVKFWKERKPNDDQLF